VASKEEPNVYRDNTPDCLSWELGNARPQVIDLIKSGKVIPEGRALDLCCGLGTNAIFLAKAGFETVALDVSETAISFGRVRAGEERAPVEFHVASAFGLPFETSEFDFVLDMGCFHHVLPEDRDTYLLGVQRVLKPFAHYFMVCFSDENGPEWNHFSDDDLSRMLEPFFDIVETAEFSSWEGKGALRHFRTVLAMSR